MSIFRRALLYTARKRARTAILFSILMAMALLILAGISIRANADRAAEDVRKSTTSSFIVEVMGGIGGDAMFTGYTNAEGEFVRQAKVKLMTQSGIDTVLAMEGVEGFFSLLGTDILYTGLEVTPGGHMAAYRELLSYSEEEKARLGGIEDYEAELRSTEANARSNGFQIVADSERHPFFINGALELVAGRHIDSGDTAKMLISDELATMNGLSIGDMLTARGMDFITGERYGAYEAEIAGIYRVNFEQDLSNWTSESDILTNTVFADKSLAEWSSREYWKFYGRPTVVSEEVFYSNATFFVEDPAALDSIIQQVSASDIVDWKYYEIRHNDDDYQTAAGPLQTLVNLSSFMVVTLIVGTLVVLSMLILMWTRGRRRELGILMSIGIPNGAILTQLLLECLLVVPAALLLSGLLAGPVTEMLGSAFAGAVSPKGSAPPYAVSVIPGTWQMQVSKVSSEPILLEYGIEPGFVAAVFAIMLAVAAASILISSGSILRMKPREVLTKR